VYFDLEMVFYAISVFFSLILLFARFAYIFRLDYGVERSWAQYSPYFPVAQYVVPPSTCDVVQVSTHFFTSISLKLTSNLHGS
jgi:hypothetical protein